MALDLGRVLVGFWWDFKFYTRAKSPSISGPIRCHMATLSATKRLSRVPASIRRTGRRAGSATVSSLSSERELCHSRRRTTPQKIRRRVKYAAKCCRNIPSTGSRRWYCPGRGDIPFRGAAVLSLSSELELCRSRRRTTRQISRRRVRPAAKCCRNIHLTVSRR